MFGVWWVRRCRNRGGGVCGSNLGPRRVGGSNPTGRRFFVFGVELFGCNEANIGPSIIRPFPRSTWLEVFKKLYSGPRNIKHSGGDGKKWFSPIESIDFVQFRAIIEGRTFCI